jgi:hypothetical protein
MKSYIFALSALAVVISTSAPVGLSGYLDTANDSGATVGTIRALGAITLGANSMAGGVTSAGGAITYGAGAQGNGNEAWTGSSNPDWSAFFDLQVDMEEEASISIHVYMEEEPFQSTSTGARSFQPGNYTTTTSISSSNYTITGYFYEYVPDSWSIAANSIIHLNANDQDDQVFIFNVSKHLVIGANVTVKVINDPENTAIVIWNVFDYVTIGASSTIPGEIRSGGYVTTGASSTIQGSVTAGGYVTTGDDSTIQGSVTARGYVSIGANSEISDFIFSQSYVTTGANAAVGMPEEETEPELELEPEPEPEPELEPEPEHEK